jgi:hypothetical protein
MGNASVRHEEEEEDTKQRTIITTTKRPKQIPYYIVCCGPSFDESIRDREFIVHRYPQQDSLRVELRHQFNQCQFYYSILHDLLCEDYKRNSFDNGGGSILLCQMRICTRQLMNDILKRKIYGITEYNNEITEQVVYFSEKQETWYINENYKTVTITFVITSDKMEQNNTLNDIQYLRPIIRRERIMYTVMESAVHYVHCVNINLLKLYEKQEISQLVMLLKNILDDRRVFNQHTSMFYNGYYLNYGAKGEQHATERLFLAFDELLETAQKCIQLLPSERAVQRLTECLQATREQLTETKLVKEKLDLINV